LQACDGEISLSDFFIAAFNNFIRRLWQNHQSRLFSPGLLVILSQA